MNDCCGCAVLRRPQPGLFPHAWADIQDGLQIPRPQRPPAGPEDPPVITTLCLLGAEIRIVRRERNEQLL